MNEWFGQRAEKYSEELYVFFRVWIGLFFFSHGSQKLLGWFGAKGVVPLMSLVGFAGAIELVAGLAITFGFLTRLAAFGSGLIMIGAFLKVHFPTSWNILGNGGELALLYLLAFIIILIHGAGKWGLEKYLLKKELF